MLAKRCNLFAMNSLLHDAQMLTINAPYHRPRRRLEIIPNEEDEAKTEADA